MVAASGERLGPQRSAPVPANQERYLSRKEAGNFRMSSVPLLLLLPLFMRAQDDAGASR